MVPHSYEWRGQQLSCAVATSPNRSWRQATVQSAVRISVRPALPFLPSATFGDPDDPPINPQSVHNPHQHPLTTAGLPNAVPQCRTGWPTLLKFCSHRTDRTGRWRACNNAQAADQVYVRVDTRSAWKSQHLNHCHPKALRHAAWIGATTAPRARTQVCAGPSVARRLHHIQGPFAHGVALAAHFVNCKLPTRLTAAR
jgi:hypothetical protein